MKKLIFLMFFIPAICSGQAIYLSFQPVDLGIGLRGDYYIEQYGFYSSISYGDWGLYRLYGLRDHFKITQGIAIPLQDYRNWQFKVNGGLNYHFFRQIKLEDFKPDNKVLRHWSFEFGLSVYTDRKITIGMRTDILKWEPCIDLGFNFRAGRCYKK